MSSATSSWPARSLRAPGGQRPGSLHPRREHRRRLDPRCRGSSGEPLHHRPDGGTITAPWFSRTSARADLSAWITAEAADARGYSLSTLSARQANGAVLDAAGGVRYVRTYGWNGGGLRAAFLGSFVTSRSRTLAGDAKTNIVLTGQDAVRYTLRRAYVAGFSGFSGSKITGDVGSITIRGDVGNWW